MIIRLEKLGIEDIAEINKIQKLAFQESYEYDLNTITIRPEYQNKGIGNQAIFLVEKRYPNALTWSLQTPEADERNRHLYEKYGYQEDGRVEVNEFLTLIQYKKQCKETI